MFHVRYKLIQLSMLCMLQRSGLCSYCNVLRTVCMYVHVMYMYNRSGAGYCFSAAAPPFTAAAASASMKLLITDGPQLIQQLKQNANQLSQGLHDIDGLKIISHAESPLVHAMIDDGYSQTTNGITQQVGVNGTTSLHISHVFVRHGSCNRRITHLSRM
jgi:7-keto-8-aminopelargonate synthetase-like enzyme